MTFSLHQGGVVMSSQVNENRKSKNHQYSIKIEKGNMASEINNYNFRRANFDAIRTELDYQTFEQPIIRNNAELGFEILKNRVNDASK